MTSQAERSETKASLKQATVLLIARQITFGSAARKKLDSFWKVRQFAASVGCSVLHCTFFRRRGRSPGLDEERESACGYERWLRQKSDCSKNAPASAQLTLSNWTGCTFLLGAVKDVEFGL